METKNQFTNEPVKFHLGRGANPRLHIQTLGGYPIASTPEVSRNEHEASAQHANAVLIVEAFNVAARTGKTPKQLSDENKQLRLVLRDCVESLKRLDDKDGAYRVTCLQQAVKAIA